MAAALFVAAAATAAHAAFVELDSRLQWETTNFTHTLPNLGLGRLSSVAVHPAHGVLLLNVAGTLALLDPATMRASSLVSSATTAGDELCFGATMSVSEAGKVLVYGGARAECFGTGGGGGMREAEGRGGSRAAHLVWEGELTLNATTGVPSGVVWTMTTLAQDPRLGGSQRALATHVQYGPSLFLVGGQNNDGDTIVELSVTGADPPVLLRGFPAGGVLSDSVYWASVVVYQDLFYIYGGDLPTPTVIHRFNPANGVFEALTTTGGQIPSSSQAVGGAGYLFGSSMVYMNRVTGGINPLRQLDLETLEWSNSFPTVTSQTSIKSDVVPVMHGILGDSPTARGARPKFALFHADATTMFQLSPEACSVADVPADMSCYPCPIGAYSRLNEDNGHQVCTLCPSGFTSAETNSFECATPCSPGTYWRTSLSTNSNFFYDWKPRNLCVDCDAGTYSTAAAATMCLSCDAGYFSGLGAESCTKCPAGQSASETFVDSGTCEDCPANFFKRESDQVCQGCPTGASSPAGSTEYSDCVCPEGQAPFPVEFEGLPPICGVCPAGAAVCSSEYPGPGLPPTVFPGEGFWNSPDDPSLILECPIAGACPGFAMGLCADGYQGEACANCAADHFFFQDQCVECPEGSEGLLVVAAIAMFLIAYAFFAIGGENPLSGLPISLAFFQTISLIVIIDLAWPRGLTKLWQSLSVFSFNVDSASPECSIDLSYYDKIAIAFCVPFFFIALFGGMYTTIPAYLTKKGKADKADKVRSKIVHGGLQLMDALYLPVVTRMVRYFVCDTVVYQRVVGDNQVETVVETLYDDPSIDCTSDAYKSGVALPAIGIVIFGCGVPAIYLVILYRIRAASGWDDYAPKAGFLYRNYTKKRWFWSVVVLLRKILLAVVVAFESVGSAQDTAIGCLFVIFFFLGVQFVARPYRSRKDNLHDAINMVFEILTIIFGLVYNEESDPSPGLVIAGGLLVGLGMCSTLYFLITDIIDKIKGRGAAASSSQVVPVSGTASRASRRPKAVASSSRRNKKIQLKKNRRKR